MRSLSKRTVDAADTAEVRYIVWDSDLKGFRASRRDQRRKTCLALAVYRPKDGGAEGTESEFPGREGEIGQSKPAFGARSRTW